MHYKGYSYLLYVTTSLIGLLTSHGNHAYTLQGSTAPHIVDDVENVTIQNIFARFWHILKVGRIICYLLYVMTSLANRRRHMATMHLLHKAAPHPILLMTSKMSKFKTFFAWFWQFWTVSSRIYLLHSQWLTPYKIYMFS